LTVAVILMVVAFCLVVLEVFVPSGGLLTILSIVSVGTSLYFAFTQSTLTGALFMAVAIIGMPLVAYKMLKLFPKTGAGRRILLFGPKGHEEVATSSELKLKQYAGKRGIAKSKLRPSGVAVFDGERVNVVSEGMIIEAGTPVDVIEVSGNRVVVRKIEDSSGRGQESAS